MSDFRRLQPAIFSGTEKPLDAEQWLVDMTDLLKAARVPDENQVEVTKIQLKDVARTWWLAESDIRETHHLGPVLKGFLREILPCNSSKKMKE